MAGELVLTERKLCDKFYENLAKWDCSQLNTLNLYNYELY